MPGLLDIGKRAGNALGAKLFTAAGQLFYASASGTAEVLAAPTIANQPLIASSGLLPSWGAPSAAVVVASDVTHTQSNTSLSDVTGLAVPIGASATEIWYFIAPLMVSAANTTVDVTFGFSVPTSCTMQWGVTNSLSDLGGMTKNSGATPTAMVAAGATQDYGTLNGTELVVLTGFIFGGGTSGNVQLRFAQRVSDASDLKVLKGSMLQYRRLAA